MAIISTEKKIVRAAVFTRVPDAQRTVSALRDAGFDNHEISVVCSEPDKAKVFGDLAEEQPVERKGSVFLMRAAMIALGLGVVGFIASTMLPTTTVLIVVAALGAVALAFGPLQALMMTRGYEKETVDFHEQELQRGDILVAVEIHDGNPEHRLDEADRILRQSGARSVELPEG